MVPLSKPRLGFGKRPSLLVIDMQKSPATASDSFSYGFRTVVPEECVGDSKGLNPPKANVCDLHIRGADVVRLGEVLNHLN